MVSLAVRSRLGGQTPQVVAKNVYFGRCWIPELVVDQGSWICRGVSNGGAGFQIKDKNRHGTSHEIIAAPYCTYSGNFNGTRHMPASFLISILTAAAAISLL